MGSIYETKAAFKDSTSLQRFVIWGCPELRCLPQGLLQPTLEVISICRCPKLETPINPDASRSLTSLNYLLIIDCPYLGSCWEEGLFCTTSLQSLHIGYFHWHSTSAASPPWSHFTSLEYLALYGWPEVKSVPDQLEHLPALRVLGICDFSGLESLPECLVNLSSLRSLNIFECPLLEKRCKKGIGEDWHKIAHIPSIYIDGVQIHLSQKISMKHETPLQFVGYKDEA